MKIKNTPGCCSCGSCDVSDMPELSIDGMTGDGWAIHTTEGGCCFVQTFEFDEEQPSQAYYSANVHASILEETSVFQDVGVKIPIPPDRYQSPTFPVPDPVHPGGPCCAEDPILLRTFNDYGKDAGAWRWAMSLRPISITLYCTKKQLSCEDNEEYFVFRAVFNHRYITTLQSYSYQRRLLTRTDEETCIASYVAGTTTIINTTTGSETFTPSVASGPGGDSPIVRFVYIRVYPVSSPPSSLTFNIDEVTQDYETCLEDLCISEEEITEVCFSFDAISPTFTDIMPDGVSIVDKTVTRPKSGACFGGTTTNAVWVDACPPTAATFFSFANPNPDCGTFTLKRVATAVNSSNHIVYVVGVGSATYGNYVPAPCSVARDPCAPGWYNGGYEFYYQGLSATQDSLSFSRTFINPIDGEICVSRPTFVVDIA